MCLSPRPALAKPACWPVRIARTHRRLGACDAARPRSRRLPTSLAGVQRARRTAHGMALIYTQRSRLLQAPSALLQPRCSRPPAPRCRSSDLGRSTLARVRPGRGAVGTQRRAQGTTHPPTHPSRADHRSRQFFLPRRGVSFTATRSWSICPTQRTHLPGADPHRARTGRGAAVNHPDGRQGRHICHRVEGPMPGIPAWNQAIGSRLDISAAVRWVGG